MKTAVEWLVEELTLNEPPKWVQEIIEQAKEMEKNQMIEFAENYEMWESENYPRKTFEQYYRETFNKSINDKG